MAINYVVRADVIDIQTDTPRNSDAFLVDSNVWYWMTYTRSSQSPSPSRKFQTDKYPAYVNAALSADSRLLHTGLSLAELSHLIEKTEREIYEQTHGKIRSKEYRHNLNAERPNVVSEVEAAWGQVKSLASSMTATIDEVTTDAALTRFGTQSVDGYDLFILEAMASDNVMQVITDDGDFATIPDIQVFTSNRNVIQTAAAQNRLVVR